MQGSIGWSGRKTTMIRVVLEIENNANATEGEIRYTIMDALAEFQSHRPSEAYVHGRYPWMSNQEKEEKVKQVERRKRVAEELRCSIREIIEVAE